MSYLQLTFPILLGLIALGAFRCWKLERKNKPYMLAAAVLCMALISWAPLAWLSARSLEHWYSPHFSGGDAQAIVVLSGNVLAIAPGRPVPVPDRNTVERCTYAAWLHQTWKPLPVLATGPNSETMRRVLEGSGVPANMIWTEHHAKSTYENALFSAEILRSKGITRIVLVTEAYHMPRSEKTFRKLGLTVVPAACAFTQFPGMASDFLPGTTPLRRHELVLHEWIGILWYWIQGRI